MDFRPNCRGCLYLSMVLQRPVACEQHAGTSAWSAAGPARPRGESQVVLPPGPVAAAAETDDAAADLLPTPELMVLFSRAEFRRLAALRARVRERLQRGQRPDDLESDG